MTDKQKLKSFYLPESLNARLVEAMFAARCRSEAEFIRAAIDEKCARVLGEKKPKKVRR